MTLVNSKNQHTSFFTDLGNVSSCSGLKGGKKRRKTRRKTRRKKGCSKRHRGGATTNILNPKLGLKEILTRGGNGSKGLYNAELATLKGGAQGYGFTADSAATMTGHGSHSHATTPVSMYKNCGLIPATSMGAGKLDGYVGTSNIQSGAGNAPFANASLVSSNQHIQLENQNQNMFPNATAGYIDGTQNAHFAGSYPPQSKSYKRGCAVGQAGGSRIGDLVSNIQNPFRDIKNILNYTPVFAQQGGTKRRKRKRRAGKHSRKRRAGKHSRKRKGRYRKRSRTQRGGYAQYNSNIPLTSTLRTAVGPAKGTWEGQLASPPTYSRINNCNDNYNHFLGKNTLSPILDQAVQ